MEKHEVWNWRIDISIRYVKRDDTYEIRTVDMFLLKRENKIQATILKIAASDMWNFVNGRMEVDFNNEDFVALEFINRFYFLTKTNLVNAKRANKRNGKPVWVILFKREKKGGANRPKTMSNEELERLQSLEKDYERIVKHCLEHDWWVEYLELEKDLCKLRGEKFDRRVYLNKWKSLKGLRT